VPPDICAFGDFLAIRPAAAGRFTTLQFLPFIIEGFWLRY